MKVGCGQGTTVGLQCSWVRFPKYKDLSRVANSRVIAIDLDKPGWTFLASDYVLCDRVRRIKNSLELLFFKNLTICILMKIPFFSPSLIALIHSPYFKWATISFSLIVRWIPISKMLKKEKLWILEAMK